MSNRGRVGRVSGGIFGLLIVICIVVAVNVILGNLHIRKDLTEDKLYVLSDGTRQILTQLERPIELKFYFNSSERGVPVYFKMFAQRVQDLLAEYRLASGGRIQVQVFDPKPDSDVEDSATKSGISPQLLGMDGPQLYLGLVASTGGGQSTEAIPFLDPRAEELLEYNITRMITRVASARKPVVGVLSSLPVLGERRPPYPMPGMPEPSPAWYAFRELRKDYDVREVQPTAVRIDDDVETLIVVHPKDLSGEAQYAIDQFVLRGGRLLAFLDPVSVIEAQQQQQMPQMRFAPKSSNLDKLLKAWSVTYDPGKVVADLEAMTAAPSPGGRFEESPVWLTLRKKHMSDDVLTARMESLRMPLAGAFAAVDSADVKVDSLIRSSDASALVDAMTAQFGGDALRREFKGGLKRLDMAIRLTGKFKTAYPDGKPKPEEKAGDEPKPDVVMDNTPGLKESRQPTTIILVGDSDMLFDANCLQQLQGTGFAMYINDNFALFANAVEQLAGGFALASIRTRGKTDRAFEAVRDLLRDAQERGMQKELALQEKLTKAQQRLRELEMKKTEGQKLFFSRQQQEEIVKLRGEEVNYKEELRQVRKELRSGIEQLGLKVKLLNIVAMPLLVFLVGAGYWGYRRLRMRV